MKIQIEIECDNDAFSGGALYRELRRILATVPTKVRTLRTRPPCLCTHPEDADRLRDVNGNTVGRIAVTDGA